MRGGREPLFRHRMRYFPISYTVAVIFAREASPIKIERAFITLSRNGNRFSENDFAKNSLSDGVEVRNSLLE